MSFRDDANAQISFFREMGQQLNGRHGIDNFNRREVFRHCSCPGCGHTDAGLYESRRRDTFIFKCPRDKCRTVLTLHELIQRVGTDKTKRAWAQARDTSGKAMFGIQNQVPYDERTPRSKKTFKERQQLKGEVMRIRATGDPN